VSIELPEETTKMTAEIQSIDRDLEHRNLRTSEIRYRRLFETARDGILIIDTVTSKITDVNPFLVELLGYSMDEILGKELWEIGLLGDVEASHGAFRELQQAGYIRYEDLPLQTKDGKQREVEFVSNVYVEDGHQVIQCNIRDVTQRKKAEKELERLMIREKTARAQAEAANRSKDEFLAIVSHELRTPLTAILGMTMLLGTGKFEDTARAIEIIERNARAQAQLIEDILDISRITAGKLRLEVRPLDLTLTINTAIDSVRHMADSKHIQIQTQFDTDMELVSGDPNRLRQVLWNLLANAIKFSPRGGFVRVQLTRAEEPLGSQAQIVVSDTGDGINADFLPYVFDRFSQADSTTTRKHGGLGLGLAITRHIVEMHGGTIQVDGGGPGKGAIFTVGLPFVAPHGTESFTTGDESRTAYITLDTVTPFQSPPELNGLRVLAIDDEPDTLEMIRAVLSRCGAQVRTCISVAAALEALESWWPDVLLSDMAMPGEDGYALIEKVRGLERERGGRTPAMALTAYVRVEDRTRVLAAGYDIFVPKPVEPDELIATLANLVKGSGKSQASNRITPSGTPG
jgi:PAS domain S-box-containing protein